MQNYSFNGIVLIILFHFNASAQALKSEKYSFHIVTKLDSIEAIQFGQFLDADVHKIKLVSLLPESIFSRDRIDSLTGEYLLEYNEHTSVISRDKKSVDQTRFKTSIQLENNDVGRLLTA